MSYAGFGPSRLPFHMFDGGRSSSLRAIDVPRDADEARRSEKLANIYHRGQDLAWDGRKVLSELIKKHGGVHLEPSKAQALSRLFGALMWGEMAAWKISAELAERLVPLEAKMAATSQAHDEARHFYVLHDYLKELGQEPTEISRPVRALLDLVLDTDDLPLKLIGMQLLIETLALTLFQAVRESNIEPVLCELLRYYEKDEARHVGLGLQFLPSLMKGMPRWKGLWLMGRQVQLLLYAMGELKAMEPDLLQVGLDPRSIFELGMAKQMTAYNLLWSELGGRQTMENEVADRFLVGLGVLLFPTREQAAAAVPGRVAQSAAVIDRLRLAAHILRKGLPDLPPTSLD